MSHGPLRQQLASYTLVHYPRRQFLLLQPSVERCEVKNHTMRKVHELLLHNAICFAFVLICIHSYTLFLLLLCRRAQFSSDDRIDACCNRWIHATCCVFVVCRSDSGSYGHLTGQRNGTDCYSLYESSSFCCSSGNVVASS